MLRSTLVLMLLIFSVSAGAQGFDYSYLQLNYGQIEFDDVDVDGDAFGVSGSFAINPNWHAFASVSASACDLRPAQRLNSLPASPMSISAMVAMTPRFQRVASTTSTMFSRLGSAAAGLTMRRLIHLPAAFILASS